MHCWRTFSALVPSPPKDYNVLLSEWMAWQGKPHDETSLLDTQTPFLQCILSGADKCMRGRCRQFD